jgi:hypothetical protein
MLSQLISDEKFTNVQNAQAGLTRLFTDAHKTSSFYRVLKNDQPLGVLIPNSLWQDIVEDMEALSSKAYKAKILRARQSKKKYSLSEVKKRLAL